MIIQVKAGDLLISAQVDEEDFDRVLAVGPWFRHSKGYAIANLPGTKRARGQILLHRFVLGLAKDDRRQVDHRNRNKLDCRRDNLRLATSGQNRQNVGSYHGSSSTHRGVSWDPSRQRWKAQGKLDGQTYFLGRFLDEEEAAVAAREWRSIYLPFAEES